MKFIRTGTEAWVHGGHALKRIHLNVNSLDSEPEGKVARIVVHEATQKIAGAVDVAYKWDNLKHNAGAHANFDQRRRLLRLGLPRHVETKRKSLLRRLNRRRAASS